MRKTGFGCLVIVVSNLLLGGFSLEYVIESCLGTHIPFFYAVIAGLFLGQFTVPLMVICWVLRLAGVHVPFFHQG